MADVKERVKKGYITVKTPKGFTHIKLKEIASLSEYTQTIKSTQEDKSVSIEMLEFILTAGFAISADRVENEEALETTLYYFQHGEGK